MNATWLALLALPPVAVAGWALVSHAWFVRWHRGAGEVAPRLGIGGFVAYHLREMWAFARLGWWHGRAFFADGLRMPARITGPPVLFVHGFTQNGTNGWGLRRRLEAVGRPTIAVSLGLPFRSVTDHAAPLVRRLRELDVSFPDGIDVVAHSMGGVVLRHVLAEHPELAHVVRRVVTLGTPHYGTASARGVRSDRRVDVAELQRGSPFIRALPAFDVVAPHAQVTTVAATTDLIVYPSSTNHLPGSHAIDLDGVGHAGLLASNAAYDAVVRALEEPSAVSRQRSARTA